MTRPSDELAARRRRIARLAAKRPPGLRVSHTPSPSAVDRLVDVLVELLDERPRSEEG